MTFRVRTQGPFSTSGSCIKGTQLPDVRSYTSSYNICEDSVDPPPYPDHSLLMSKSIWKKCEISGSTGTPGTAGYRFASATPVEGGSGPSHLFIPGVPSDGTVAAETVARTNPSRSHVSLPVFFAELRELPRLVRDIGSAVTRNGNRNVRVRKPGSSSTLTVEFGLKPLISDLLKLLTFQESVEKTFRDLKALRDNGGISRTHQAFKGAAERSENLILESYLGTVRAQFSDLTTLQVWGAVKWVPNQSFPFSDSDAILRGRARQLALGMHPSQSLANVWNALPWSWLIDWYTNTGDIITGNNNSVALQFGAVNVCTETHTGTLIEPTLKPSWATVSDGYRTLVTKKRTLASPSLFDASWPILTNRQLSILGALAVLKLGR